MAESTNPYDGADFEIGSAYDWCVRAFSIVQSRLGLKIKFHHDEGQVETGQIFLFNHFARFETVVPQYLINQATGAYCRCVASSELFRVSEKFSKFLFSVGALPNDLPGLLPFLAAEILKGRKVIVFPEGGMVKDRQVIDDKGKYSIFSPSADARRKHHAGAAVIALTLEIFKKRILSVHKAEEWDRLGRWVQSLGLESTEALLEAARQPTLIVPANITFYPIRVTENVLTKGLELFGGELTGRVLEELIIEGNILFKDTDMDIRLGDAINPDKKWRWWETKLLDRLFNKIDSLDDLFNLHGKSERLDDRLIYMLICLETRRIRDAYMREMYTGVTVNLSHLASTLIQKYADSGKMEVECALFHKALFLAIKNVQKEPSVHLHRSMVNPGNYKRNEVELSSGFNQFITSKACSELVVREADRYRFLPKLLEDHGFHETRLENLIDVYANEMAPITAAVKAVERAMEMAPDIDDRAMAHQLFDDERVSYAWNKGLFSQPEFEAINAQETATESGEPYLIVPDKPREMGIVLVHGFLASPAELREFGEKLGAAGYPVLGVRLEGHGTSPWDLRDRSWQDWLQSVRRGYQIMSAFTNHVCVIGFSTGAALALHLAAEQPEGLAGVVAVSPPIKFQNKNMAFVPLVHGANKLTHWIPALEGFKPFRQNPSEHPHINYSNMPIRGLYELRLMVAELQRRLPDIKCPVEILQGTEDKVVKPESAEIIKEKIGSEIKRIHMIESNRHGIINENIGNTHETIISMLDSLMGMKKFEQI